MFQVFLKYSISHLNKTFFIFSLWILEKSWDISAKLKTIDKNLHVLPQFEFTNSLT